MLGKNHELSAEFGDTNSHDNYKGIGDSEKDLPFIDLDPELLSTGTKGNGNYTRDSGVCVGVKEAIERLF